VSITTYQGNESRVRAIRPELLPHTQFLGVVTNSSDKVITGLSVIWMYTSIRDGRPKRMIHSVDSYIMPAKSGVVGSVADPGAAFVVAPPETGFTRMLEAKDGVISIELDAVIFSDGELVGPDTLAYGDEIMARFAASREVVSRIRKAPALGKSIQDVIAESQRNENPGGVRGMDWVASFFHRLGATNNPALQQATIERIANMPQPPVIGRRQEKTLKEK
jgi:hypothetical protein